ncbi:MAG: hypothetical protein ACLFQM_02960 [Fidelibacterota bacterium]
MNAKTKVLLTSIITMSLAIILATGCSESGITNPAVSAEGIAASEIQFIQWDSKITETFNTLDKTTVSEKIFTKAGGVLSTADMYGCKLTVPSNAFPEDERLIQASLTITDDNFAGIEFLPSQQFTKAVTIELPFSAIRVDDENEYNEIRAFWYDEESGLWVEIPDVKIDTDKEVVEAEIDHFTRFGWGF